MYGGAGNDTYVVDDVGDIVDESVAGSGGIDRVLSALSINLSNATRIIGDVENAALLDWQTSMSSATASTTF